MTSRAIEVMHPSCRPGKAELEAGTWVDAGFEEAMGRHAETQGERRERNAGGDLHLRERDAIVDMACPGRRPPGGSA